MNISLIPILLAFVLAPAVAAWADDSRPAYSILPFEEDWSALARDKQQQSTDTFDRLKYIPLTQSGSAWLSFGAEERLRVENWNDFLFAGPEANDDTFVLNRLRMHADLHVGKYVRLYVGGKSGIRGAQDLAPSTRQQDEDTFDLQNAFTDLTLPLAGIFGANGRLTLRLGRQEMIRGSERFIGLRNFAQVRQSFDGATAMLYAGDWRITGFGLRIVDVEATSFNDFHLADSDNGFFGIYSEGFVPRVLSDAIGFGPMGLDLFGLRRDQDKTFNETSGAEDRYALGGRMHGAFPISTFSYEIEGAYELGTVNRTALQGGDADINASMFVVELNYQPKEPTALAVGPIDLTKVQLAFDYSSGDDSPGGDVGTFDPLFQTRHRHLGYQDFIGRFNIMDLRPRVDFGIGDRTTLSIVQHVFWRTEKQDALYNVAGGVIAAGGAGTDKFVGSELDLTLKYRIDRHLVFQPGYSRFFTGSFLNNSGLGQDVNWFYTMLTYTL